MPPRVIQSLAVVVGCVFAVGCLSRGPQPFAVANGEATLDGVPLRDGDVVVSRAGNPGSVFLARHGPTPGPFSHAGVFLHAPGDPPRVYHLRDGGGRIAKAEDFFRKTERVGVYRLHPAENSDRLGLRIRVWLGENDIRKLPFTLFPDPDNFHAPPYNCNTFVNVLYIEAGFPPPFVQPQSPRLTSWSEEISRFFGSDWTRITASGVVAHNPLFEEVVVWHNPAIDPRLTAGLEGFSDAIRAEIEGGRRLRSRARRAPARIMSAWIGDADIEYATPEAIAIHFNLKDAWSQVRKRLTTAIRRDGDAFREEYAYELGRRLALNHLGGVLE